jgi:hypothetical protein
VKVAKSFSTAILYGCKTWSLTLREEHKLRVSENRVLRRILILRVFGNRVLRRIFGPRKGMR